MKPFFNLVQEEETFAMQSNQIWNLFNQRGHGNTVYINPENFSRSMIIRAEIVTLDSHHNSRPSNLNVINNQVKT